MAMSTKTKQAKALRREFEAGARDARRGLQNRFFENFKDGLAKKHLQPERFSVAALFEEFVEDGHELRESFNPQNGGGDAHLLEAGGPVNTGNFANITGQIIFSKILDAYNQPGFLGEMLVDTIPTSFDGEKVPGIGQIGDEAESIAEGHGYPLAGFSEEWVETPNTIKRGFIVPVTKEAIFFDRTGIIMKRAGDVANWIHINKEKRILDLVLGITTAYRRNGGTAIATYGDTPYDNLAASNALVDWTNVQTALLNFDALSDPNTGEPITIVPDTMIVPTALEMTAERIVHATQIIYGAAGSTSPTTLGFSGNPLKKRYNILSSPYVSLRAGSASTWWVGQPKKAFAYMENWPITVQQAPTNSEAEFTHDIVARFKVSERGAAAVLDPRYVVKSTA